MAQKNSNVLQEQAEANHIPDEFGFRFAEANQFPQMVVCGMAFNCNARCIHCPNAATGFDASVKKADQFMTWETFKKVADECAKYPHNMVRVSSAGEILIHPKAMEYIEYLLKVKTDKNVVLTTNGSLLTPAKSKRLLEGGIRAIEISVDAADAETFEKIRLGLRFEKVLSNIMALKQLRDEGGYKTSILVSVIEQPANEGQIQRIIDYWADKADKTLVRKLLNFKGLIERPEHYEDYLPEDTPCPFLWERVLIDSTGNIRACVSDIWNDSFVANVNQSSIHEAWTSPQMQGWRKEHLNGGKNNVPFCAKCTDLEKRSWNFNFFKALDTAAENKEA